MFFSYLKQIYKNILIYILFCSIFIISFALYRLPLKAVIYPMLICAVIGAFFIFINFISIKNKHILLSQISKLTDNINDILPKAQNIQENDYQNIIHSLSNEYNNLKIKTERKYLNTIDYYTVWVHQIKTPITSIRLNIQNEDSDLSRRLSVDLFRIEQYVEMVLTFLKLENHGSDYVIKEYNLDNIIKSSVKKFAREFISRNLTLIYNPLNTNVITDEKWLSFVIEQVLSNALKYTYSGSISIYLKPNKTLCIEDTGIGIAPEDIPRIFENGYTGYNGRKDKKATGIGLYLCKRICSNLGHKIIAESQIDKGTCIYIDLAQEHFQF